MAVWGISKNHEKVRYLEKSMYLELCDEDCISSWWFQPNLKNASQIGTLPHIGVKIKNI